MKTEQLSATTSALIAIIGVLLSLAVLRYMLSFLLNHWIAVSIFVAVLVLAGLGYFVDQSRK